MEIKSSRPVSVSEAKDIMARRKEEGELGYEQGQAQESTERFGTTDSKKLKKLVDALTKYEKISEELAVKIIDIRPDNAATLRAVLVKDRVELTEDELNSIIRELA